VNASQTFGYDHVNRLTASSESGTGTPWTRNYAYDEWGNGWVTLNSIVPLDPRTPLGASNFGANNQLNIDGAAYNAAGNQTAIAGFTNTYDAENRLLTSTLGVVTTTYTYDGDGRRVQKATGGSTTVYVYDAQGQLAAEYDTPVPAALCATCYLTADHLGSTRMMTDGTTGAPVAFHDYLPFGEEIEAGVGGRLAPYYPVSPLAINDDNTLKFTGKERDTETGLDNFEVRYFGSPQGRFTSADEPLAYADPENPQTWNLYSYATSSPLTFADDGHMRDCPYGVEPGGNNCKPNPKDIEELSITLLETSARKMQEVAIGALQSVYQYLSLPRNMGCVASQMGAVSMAGTMIGAGAGGIAGGGTALITAPGGFLVGGVAGWASGMNSCIQGSGSGGRGGGRGGGSGSGLSRAVREKLGNLASRAGEKVRDVIRSRGGNASNVREAGHWADETLGDAARAAVGGDQTAEKAIKMVKQAADKAQRY